MHARINFETCFPNKQLDVKVGFKAKQPMGFNMPDYPYCLQIQESTRRHKNTTETTLFIRDFNLNAITYDELYQDVVVSRKTSSNNTKYCIQSYNRYGKWAKGKTEPQQFIFNDAMLGIYRQ